MSTTPKRPEGEPLVPGDVIEIRGSFTPEDGETEYGPWIRATVQADGEPDPGQWFVVRTDTGNLHARGYDREGVTWRRQPTSAPPTTLPPLADRIVTVGQSQEYTHGLIDGAVEAFTWANGLARHSRDNGGTLDLLATELAEEALLMGAKKAPTSIPEGGGGSRRTCLHGPADPNYCPRCIRAETEKRTIEAVVAWLQEQARTWEGRVAGADCDPDCGEGTVNWLRAHARSWRDAARMVADGYRALLPAAPNEREGGR